MTRWVVHVVLTMTDEDVECGSYGEAAELLHRIAFCVSSGTALVLDDGLVLNASQIVKAWAEAVG